MVIRMKRIAMIMLVLSFVVQLFGVPFFRDSSISAAERIVVPGIAAGVAATLFLTPDGKVRATGSPSYGETGVGAVSVPTVVAGLSNVKQVALKNWTSFVLLDDSTVKSWGYGGNYELGSGSTSSRSIPTLIPNLSNVKQIEAGSNFAVALLKDGTVKAWGSNGLGQIGNNSTVNAVTPTLVTGLTNVKKISVGSYHVLALLNDGTIKAWGQNTSGQLGLGDTNNRQVPTSISGLTGIKDISAGYSHSLAIASDGTVRAWGLNSNGQLGNGTTTASNTPVSSTNLSNVLQISAGNNYSMALTSDGTPRVWGNSANYQLGLGISGYTHTPTAITTISDSAQVISGNTSSFIIMNDYSVKAMGNNSSYQLGIGNNSTQPVPVDVNGLKAMTVPMELELFDLLGKEVVSSSNSSSSFLLDKGRVKAWGYNYAGQLGIGNTIDQSTPTLITNLDSVKQLSTGQSETLALLEDGTVKAWGLNSSGQLGLGDLLSRKVPTIIPSLSGVKQLSLGEKYALALMEDGTVKAWGYNIYGQLGLGDTTSRSTPTTIPGLNDVRQLSVGQYHAMALLENGTVKAWGYNNYGQLGMGDTVNRSTPTIIPGLSGVKQINSGYSHTLALMVDGTVKAWGYNNYGQLGLGDTTNRSTPTTVTSLPGGVRQLSGGFSFSLALMEDGRISAWGYNNYGQLGLGDTTNRSTPTLISGMSNIRQLSAGQSYSLALAEDGIVRAWGFNNVGQLGLGDKTNRTTPTTIANQSGISKLSAGFYHTLALMKDGTVKAWGYNFYGQLGIGNTTNRSEATIISSLNGVKQLSVGQYHTLALMEDGKVRAWGSNAFGQLGLGDTANRNIPTVISGLGSVKQLVSGYSHVLALLEDGTVKAWGDNGSGQLGLGDTTSRSTPTTIPGLGSVKELAAGSSFTLALLEDGTVKAWGNNSFGQLGLGDTTNRILPTIINGLNNVRELSAGSFHSLALMEDRTVKTWGYNFYGQLGLGDTTNRKTPTSVSGLGGVSELRAGQDYSLAVMDDKTVKGWGSNHSGQLGLGDTANRSIPTNIINLSNVGQITGGSSHTLSLMEDGTVKAWGNNNYGQLGYLSNRFSPTTLSIESLTYQPRLFLSGRTGSVVDVKYYVDSELTPRESKNIILTDAGESLSFEAVDSLNFSDGVHTLRVEASDGVQVVQKTGSFTVDNAPTANNYSATVTMNSITARVTSSENNLATLPFRFSINQTTSAWLANQSGASYTFNSLAVNEKYPVTYEVKDTSGKVTTATVVYYTLAERPSLTRTETNPDRVTMKVTDTNPAHTRYQVMVGNRFVDENGALVAEPVWMTVSDKTFVIKGLSPSKSYQVKIKARNQEGIETEESAVVQVGTPIKPPAIPQQVKAVAAINQITLSWNPVPDATDYEVMSWNPAPVGATSPGPNIVSVGASTSYVHTGLVSNSKQLYQVRAVKSGVYGEWSNPVQAMTLLPSPAIPTNVTATSTSKTVMLSWNQVATALSYEVEWDGRILSVGPQTTFKQIGLQPGSQHVYRVRAVNGAGAGVWSAQAAILTKTTPPTAITSLTGDASDKSVSLRWLPIDDASYYEIEADGQLFQNGISFFAELKGLIPGTAHQYRVRAVNEYGTGPWSSPLTLTTNKLPTPVQVKDKPEDKAIGLTWEAVPQATSYQVEADGQLQTFTTPSFTHNGLTPETTHTYRVRATGAEGTSGWSATLTVKTLPLKPIAPATVNALAGKDYVTLTWNQVSGATAYEVEIDGKVVVDNFNETRYTDTLLDPFTPHTYRVRSKTDAVEGEWTLPVSIQTLPDRPVAPAGIVVSSSGNIVTLKWEADPSALGYDLEVNGQLVNNGLNTEYKHRRVSVGSEHKYRVRTRNQAGIGDWSGLILNNNMTAKLSKGKTVNLGLTGSNVTDFSRYTLTVTYDPNAMSVVDLSTLTGAPEVTTGRIEGTDITITAFRPGQIVFVTDRVVKPGETWTGVINSIKFMASVSGGSALTYSVIQN